MALAYLREAYGDEVPSLSSLEKVGQKTRDLVVGMISAGINSPLTSSCGRLFDAVSYLAGLAPLEVEFEAEAPLRLEAVSRRNIKTSYPYELLTDREPWQLSFAATIREIVREVSRTTSPEKIGAVFHRTLAEAIACVSARAREAYGIDTVALVGGVFLNTTLLTLASRILQRQGFEVLRPRQYSPNDESISIGQVAYALARLKARR
jgi:hydrogenase maturation protein HypF